ncbi:MAG: methionine gamma-lyase [Pseudomonadota bacterium]|nr:methionine gamma-lyase [Pseudomonadota bacterium]MDP1905656.1 methionine gamma-lyase [Pseudomonadota bacterium]MDP2353283.1 methionine gamma-lyase [Pseudomonadota bacterium]
MKAAPLKPLGFATRAIHLDHDPRQHEGALVPPIYLTSTFAFESTEQGRQRFAGEIPGYIYSRVGNPTVALLESRLADLEGGEAALCTASGMGAITSAIYSLVQAGDEIVADQTLYGCTFGFFHHGLARLGVTVNMVDMTQPDNISAAITPRTRLLFCESPTNPNMRLIDIAAIAAIGRSHSIPLMVDNTYCTPYLQRPIELGAQYVVHSATKYLGGHGDLLAGAVVGPDEDIQRMRFFGIKEMTGAVMSPFDAFLVLRGLKTLALRMDRHCVSAASLAGYLAAHPAVAGVAYPGLPEFPQYELARRQMAQPGGMIALELKGGFEAGRAFMDALNLCTRAVSLGDAETLVQHPASMTHSTYTPEEQAAHGISPGLVRLSVGLEDVADLQADLDQALATV